jgi:L-2-hydroxyglutarate oxidase LhgO
MDYDVLILGGGIIGCAVAYELSKYSLNIALIEKDYDIADDVALVNSAIVYNGVESEDTLMAKLEIMGNSMFDEISARFNIPFKRCGTLLVAEGEKGEKTLNKLYKRALERGINDVEILDSTEVYKLEPNMNNKVAAALHSKSTGIIDPYELALAYGEIAFDNGVIFRLEEEVLDIQNISKGVKVITNKNKITCKMVVNTTPGENYSINEEKKINTKQKAQLSYFLSDENYKEYFSNIVFTLKENGDKIYAFKTHYDTIVAGVNTKEAISFEENLSRVSTLVNGFTDENIDSFYQADYDKDIIIVDDSYINKGYINITGKHYAQVTMTPSISKMVCETIVNNMNCQLKKDFNDRRREVYKFRNLSDEERNNIIEVDERYGRMVCLCQQITEGEIVDCIRRPLGARTVEGVKRRTGVTLGRCKGAYCISRIISILARETNKQLTEIVKDSKNSKLLLSRIKEFDSI